jgi:hypothetical protein
MKSGSFNAAGWNHIHEAIMFDWFTFFETRYGVRSFEFEAGMKIMSDFPPIREG